MPIGMLVTAILVVNNYRDIVTDERAGKRTLAVAMGAPRTRALYSVLIFGAFATIALFGASGWTPLSTLFSAFLLPYASVPLRIIAVKSDGPSLVRALAATARLHLWVGVSLAAAVALAP
jgi:1,4-dihydroxy-2-naphthoate octaprenyltransferase